MSLVLIIILQFKLCLLLLWLRQGELASVRMCMCVRLVATVYTASYNTLFYYLLFVIKAQ